MKHKDQIIKLKEILGDTHAFIKKTNRLGEHNKHRYLRIHCNSETGAKLVYKKLAEYFDKLGYNGYNGYVLWPEPDLTMEVKFA